MSSRPDFTPDVPLTPDQLANLRQGLARLSTPSLETAYMEAWERCKLTMNGRAPRADAVQELVQTWKVLRKSGELAARR